MNRPFFVPNSWNRYGCDTPARTAMACVDVPAYPRAANSREAAAITSVRRSSALSRVVVFMATAA